MHHRFHGLAAALALGLPLLAAAQTRADPADPHAPARALSHRSTFADYKPFQDITPGDWRRLNDTVGAASLKPSAGGGAAPAPAGAASAPAPASTMPMPMPMPPMQGHHHDMHGGKP